MSRYVGVFEHELRASYYEFIELKDRGDALMVRLGSDNDRDTNITFNEFLAYRAADEGDLMRTVDEIAATGGGKWIYQVENSEFLTWLADASYGVRDIGSSNLRHYCIVTSSKIIDVITLADPIFAPANSPS